ncbi:myelin-oligodendrocyte glycoprotein-like isoform X2 [Micropterus salmoides]|uniref:myelin-oligodendrocyte glycoprotein-like isoform X2 n=1 Tax=Micropterus salmoides TaxID=27706 RepID=UPI0018ED2D0E|nr:myelin-oligodendrocyte glycoprotein-like isoform X2 [Micropterus salmoides]
MEGTHVKLLCIILFAETVTGEPHAICPNSRIQALEGDTVTLPCYLVPARSVVDRTFDWKRVDLNKVVYAYRHKQENPNDQMAHYRGRTTVNLDDLSRGNMTLQISSVQLADTGPYSCFVPKLETSCVTDLTVVEQVTSTTRPPPDEPSNPDGDNRQLIAIVPSTVVGIVIIICVLVGVLVRRGMI